MIQHMKTAAAACAGVLALTGCTVVQQMENLSVPGLSGHNRTISIVDSAERINLDTTVNLSDIIAFAENMTNKMLQSPVFAQSKKKPRIIVGRLSNNTHDENLKVSDIHDRIQEVLFNSGTVRILDRSATSFDYIMKTEITDTVQRSGDGQKLVGYSMKIKLYKMDGELAGQWSDDLTKYQSR